MDAPFVKNSVMDANIDETVVMDRSGLKICKWNKLRPSGRKLLEKHEWDEPLLLVGIPDRDPNLWGTILGERF